MFGFQNLIVYQKALAFTKQARDIAASLPHGQGGMVDQLRRASVSIPLNIAEGVGRFGQDDNHRHFVIARGSAMECAAILDICRTHESMDQERLNTGTALLLEIVRMLTAMAMRSETDQTKTKTKTKTKK